MVLKRSLDSKIYFLKMAAEQLTLKQIRAQLIVLSNKEIAKQSQRYFKTGPGEYGEGDRFLGLPVPQLHALSKQGTARSFEELQNLLDSEWHEERVLALMILVLQIQKQLKVDPKKAKVFVDFYLKNTRAINNWDLVDGSARDILGAYLLETGESRAILYKLAASQNLWERRIAVISTFAFLRANDYEDTFKLCERLLKDPHDLMHKAMGWMLREIGKRNLEAEEDFLRKHASVMPRTMLRYAIERFPESLRKSYLAL